MKARSLIVGVIIVLLLLLFPFIFENKQALASDQKLVHGAGTLPHLTSAITLSGGLEIPTPFIYALRYDIGLGNRVQLGFSASLTDEIKLAEIHSMFNVLKTDRDSDFLSLYLSPYTFRAFPGSPLLFSLRTGVAYEHRFGDRRHQGFYTKIGIDVKLKTGQLSMIYFKGGYQALLGKHFSIALEGMLIREKHFIKSTYFFPAQIHYIPGGKVALTWAF